MKNKLKIIALAAIIVFSAVACKGNSKSVAVSDSAPAAGSTSNSIDGLIDEYEQLVNEYLSILPRIMAGELAAADEADRIADGLDNWAERIVVFSDDEFTPAQLLRFEALYEKLNEAF